MFVCIFVLSILCMAAFFPTTIDWDFATDTHRLAVKSALVKDGRGSQNAIVPARAMNELIRLLTDGDGDVQVTLSNNQVQFALPDEAGVQVV